MSWTFAGAPLQDPLSQARSGLAQDGVLVDGARFHRMVALAAVRLLQHYAAFVQREDHEIDWNTRAIVAIDAAAEPPGSIDNDAVQALYPAGFLGLMATMNTLQALHGASRPEPMQLVVTWIGDALAWATKRHHGDRHCPHDASGLLARAVDLQGVLADGRRDDVDAAQEAERGVQRAQLVGPLPPLVAVAPLSDGDP